MIRVIRLMEYIYPDVETMDNDMMQWYVPPNGSKRVMIRQQESSRMIRSAVIIEPIFPDEDMRTQDETSSSY